MFKLKCLLSNIFIVLVVVIVIAFVVIIIIDSTDYSLNSNHLNNFQVQELIEKSNNPKVWCQSFLQSGKYVT